MPHPRRLHRLPALIVVVAGLGAGAACSGSGGNPNGVATLNAADHKTTDTTAKKASGSTNPQDAALDYARCMREHGIDMPDPDTSGGPGTLKFTAPAGGKLDGDGSKFEEADKACHDILGNAAPANVDPKQAQEMQDQALAFSRCMREHGINMPDPTFGSGGQMTMKIDKDSGIDPSDPKFEEAQKACGSAFGPGGTKGGAGLSVDGKSDGGSAGKGGTVVFGGGAATASNGGAK